jgi:radical SAM superfamily enzyme YgiQ (UPF0313 family)
MRRTEPLRVLAVNPWIHDFAAYDFWARPVGLLYLAAMLEQSGARVDYFDCLARDSPKNAPERFGRGPYAKTPLPGPKVFFDVPRTFSRYGVPPETFRNYLTSIPRPDAALVTCLMTYWHTGAFEAMGMVREAFPDVPVILGGIYATLFPGHARRFSGADVVVEGAGEEKIFSVLTRLTGFSPKTDFSDFSSWPIPLLSDSAFAPVLGSLGCPMRCGYCASGFLQKNFRARGAGSIIDEILLRFESGIRDFAFYDDALLVDAEYRMIPVLDRISLLPGPVRIHLPNAVHARFITADLAKKMFRAGVKTLRMGLETAWDRQGLDEKLTMTEFLRAAVLLREAGFDEKNLGAYLLCGLPGQDMEGVARSILAVKKTGVRPILAHFSPMPHTALWEKAKQSSRYDLENEPLCTNNSAFPCLPRFDWGEISRLKRLCVE